MSSVGWTVFIVPSKLSSHTFFFVFFDILVDNIKNCYYKVRQLLQNETKNSYQKFTTKCDRSLLQSVEGITKCDRLLLQTASGITKCDRLLLQSASGFTKCTVITK